MLPSEELRKYIAEKIGKDLDIYSWNYPFTQFVFSIHLDEDYERKVHYLSKVYKLGFNIGHCGLTSRYLVMSIPHTDLFYGKFPALAGTKNSPAGGHAWAVCGDFVLDTTLMLAIPIQEAKNLGYIFEKKISQESARMLSEYELFSNEYDNYIKDKESYVKTLVPKLR